MDTAGGNGKQDGMIVCDGCKRKIAVRGLKSGMVQEGDYEATFFWCPMCGKRFLVLCTDGEQRQLMAEHKRMMGKIRTGREKHFRPNTIKGYQRDGKRLAAAMSARSAELRKIGEKMLEGKVDN